MSLLALAGCKTSTQGNATPTTSAPGTQTEATQSGSPGVDAPKVTTPLDTARSQQAPCDTLTQAQADEWLGPRAVAKPDLNGTAGPACSWYPPSDSIPNIRVIFTTKSTDGITGVYRASGKQYKFFKPLPAIGGNPVAAYGTNDYRNTEGRCSVAVGATDQSTVDVSLVQSPANIGKKDPCDGAREIAGLVLDNIRKAR
ncbi:DUF3558 domain-containing protein [Amycolatopsis sp. NPDC059021]|uniref:DUF3558 domain-containing protein n=1 Tax=Amycolatopsis sp. NPDC059021 TaxID=3346704 RepID=UPI0036716354